MIFKYFIIGLLQGFTEFLPVSSSGHIVLFSHIFNIDCDIILLSVVVHIGTLFSVLICMRTKIKEIIQRPFGVMSKNLVLATIPTILFVILFNDVVNKLYGINFIVYGFIISAVLLIVADLVKPKYRVLHKKHSIYMGVMQGIAILPGISRSGSTMAIGMMTGLQKDTACEFSFLMSIPVIIGSAIWEGFSLIGTKVEVAVLPLIVAFVTSFIFGILSIKFMLRVIKKNKLIIFSIYLLLISIFSVVYIYFILA